MKNKIDQARNLVQNRPRSGPACVGGELTLVGAMFLFPKS